MIKKKGTKSLEIPNPIFEIDYVGMKRSMKKGESRSPFRMIQRKEHFNPTASERSIQLTVTFQTIYLTLTHDWLGPLVTVLALINRLGFFTKTERIAQAEAAI